jgi:hypothetical protein
MSKQINLIINEKGGVGKSFFATNLVQYLRDGCIAHQAFDTDHENSTLKRFHPEAEVRAEKKNRKGAASGDFLEFQGTAGLGQAEAAELTWAKVDFDVGEMKIKRVKTGKYFPVPLYPKLRTLLDRIKNEAEARAKKENRELQKDERVFIIDNARKALTNACERLKMPAFTQRNLRQMFIVEAYRAGVDVKTPPRWREADHGHLHGSTRCRSAGIREEAAYEASLTKPRSPTRRFTPRRPSLSGSDFAFHFEEKLRGTVHEDLAFPVLCPSGVGHVDFMASAR